MRNSRYPTIRVGGLFVAAVGMVVLASSLLGGAHPISPVVFFVGFGFAVVGVLFNGALRSKLVAGELSSRQRTVLRAAIALEVVLIVAASALVGRTDERLYWLLVFLAVAVHFLPLTLVHGPWMGLLGVLCAGNAVVGLLLSAVPFLALAVSDALLKIILGGVMFFSGRRARAVPE